MIGCIKSQKRNGYLMRLLQQSGKNREAKLEGMCVELESANSKGNSI